jgi:hypothetical protein
VGNTGAPNEPAPQGGTILAQGDFVGLNGKSVGGAAAVYDVGTAGTFVLHLSGLSAPVESGLAVVVVANGSEQGSNTLRSSQGSQNYFITMVGSPKWNQIIIRNSSTKIDYGQASLK